MNTSNESYIVYRLIDTCHNIRDDLCYLFVRDKSGIRKTLTIPSIKELIIGYDSDNILEQEDNITSLVESLVGVLCVEDLYNKITYYRGERLLKKISFHNTILMNKSIDRIKYNQDSRFFLCNSHISIESATLLRNDIHNCLYIRVYSNGTISRGLDDDKFPYEPLVGSFDLETTSLDPTNSDGDVYTASYESYLRRVIIYEKSYCNRIMHSDSIEYIQVENNCELAKTLLQVICEDAPDILTGYNIYNADIPLIYHILGRDLIPLPSIDSNGPRSYYVRTSKAIKNYVDSDSGISIKIPGCHVIDMYHYLNKMLPVEDKHDMRLGSISERYLGSTKDPFTYGDLVRIYESGTNDEKIQVMNYCLKDSYLCILLFDKFNCWNYLYSIYTICGVDPQKYFCVGIVDITYGMYIKTIYGSNIYIDEPCRDIYRPGGGLTLDTTSGLHMNVVCIDIGSLYPNIAIAHNIDSLSIINDSETNIVSRHGRFIRERYYYITEDRKVTKLVNRYNIPTFIRQDTYGILPTVLRRLLDDRLIIKSKIQDIKDTNSIERLILQAEEQAIKTCANGACGAKGEQTLGNPVSYCLINDLITTTGRCILGTCKSEADLLSIQIIYGDTDSLIMKSNDINRYLSIVHSKLPDNIRFKVEYRASHFIIGSSKKKYIARINNTTKIVGYKSVKSSYCKASKIIFTEVIDSIINGGIESSIFLYRQLVDYYSTYIHDIDMFSSNIYYSGKAYKENTYMEQIIRAMTMRRVDIVPGNKLSVVTVLSKEDYLSKYGQYHPTIILPEKNTNKALRIYTTDEIANDISVVDIVAILERECGNEILSIVNIIA